MELFRVTPPLATSISLRKFTSFPEGNLQESEAIT